MLKYFFIFILVVEAALAQKISVDDRRKRILSIIDEELAEVSRLAQQQDYKNPESILRISELQLEKARLWREIENETFLSVPADQRRTVNKSSYFKKSAEFFEAANNSALGLVKRFPDYKLIGEVYYIIGYNKKELGEQDEAKKFFKLSADKTPSSSKIKYKAQLASADYYYNDKKYEAAIPLYEASIKNLDERWWTKDSFNLAWCYYRTKDYNRAIDLLKKVHTKSATGKYIDMRTLVERDIGVFYVDAGRIDDAVQFYQKLGLNFSEQFIKISNAIMTQGKFSQAEALLNHASKVEKNRERRIEILLAQLTLYDKFKKTDLHLKAAQELVALHQKKPLQEDQLRALIFQVDKSAAELQKAITSNIYQNVPQVQNQKSKDSITYFQLSSVLAPNKKAEKTFYQGETAYAAGKYQTAVNFYLEAFDAARSSNDQKIMSQCVEGMLSSLGQSSFDSAQAEKLYVPVYSRYLAFDSKTERAKTIFVKLFNAQFDSGDVKGSEETLSRFSKSFPGDYKTQEGMLAKIMEHYRTQKDYSTVKTYVQKINQGEFKVSNKYAAALRNLMTKIQIEGVQQSLERGEKGVALKGYHQIYNSPESTPKAKTNAAYNLAALYHELGNSSQSYSWAVTALSEMDVPDVASFADSFLGIAAGLFLRQSFTQSADLSQRMLDKLCKENSSNKTVAFKNAVFISIANGDLDKALEIRKMGSACLVPDQAIAEVSFELLKDLAKAKRWEDYERMILELEKNSKNSPQLILPLEALKQEYLRLGDTQLAQELQVKQSQFYQLCQSQKLDIPVEALDLIADKMIESVVAKKQRIEQIVLKFPETDFNNAVKQKLQGLDELTSEVDKIQKLGSGKGIVKAYHHLVTAYEDFGISLKNFVPEGKGPEYVESFKKAMAEIYNPILMNSKKLRQDAIKLIKENKILSAQNLSILFSTEDGPRKFISKRSAVLMDRGGRR
jgi:hypothetical protein